MRYRRRAPRTIQGLRHAHGRHPRRGEDPGHDRARAFERRPPARVGPMWRRRAALNAAPAAPALPAPRHGDYPALQIPLVGRSAPFEAVCSSKKSSKRVRRGSVPSPRRDPIRPIRPRRVREDVEASSGAVRSVVGRRGAPGFRCPRVVGPPVVAARRTIAVADLFLSTSLLILPLFAPDRSTSSTLRDRNGYRLFGAQRPDRAQLLRVALIPAVALFRAGDGTTTSPSASSCSPPSPTSPTGGWRGDGTR